MQIISLTKIKPSFFLCGGILLLLSGCRNDESLKAENARLKTEIARLEAQGPKDLAVDSVLLAKTTKNEIGGLIITSYGHTPSQSEGGCLDVRWHVRIRNPKASVIPSLLVTYRWLDKNQEELESINASAMLGANEEITFTDTPRPFKSDIYKQVRHIGIQVDSGGIGADRINAYKVFPMKETGQ